jgi:hypothetical protein
MIIIDGTTVSGLGAASQTVPQQLPIIIQYLPALQTCEPRTINVQLYHQLIVQRPDITLQVAWGGGMEAISLVEIEFECPIGGQPKTAWIYHPHGSPHRVNLFFAELITTKIVNLQHPAKCRLLLRRGSYLV